MPAFAKRNSDGYMLGSNGGHGGTALRTLSRHGDSVALGEDFQPVFAILALTPKRGNSARLVPHRGIQRHGMSSPQFVVTVTRAAIPQRLRRSFNALRARLCARGSTIACRKGRFQFA